MLAVALDYKEELIHKLHSTWFKDKYKYYHYNNYHRDLSLSEDTWNVHQFVSLNNEGEVVGYLEYYIDRSSLNCSDFNIVNFGADKITFGKDLHSLITDIFEKFHFNKLSFSVVIGNPVEASYDKLIRNYGGRVVGIQKNHVRLLDNLLYDVKLYEVTSYDYLNKKYNKEV